MSVMHTDRVILMIQKARLFQRDVCVDLVSKVAHTYLADSEHDKDTSAKVGRVLMELSEELSSRPLKTLEFNNETCEPTISD